MNQVASGTGQPESAPETRLSERIVRIQRMQNAAEIVMADLEIVLKEMGRI